MELKNRIEAILLAANRALTLKDICELLEIDNSEHESEVMNSIYKLKDEFETVITVRKNADGSRVER